MEWGNTRATTCPLGNWRIGVWSRCFLPSTCDSVAIIWLQ